jgi:hypothetical protein
VQQFANLPPGEYAVTAVARNTRGQRFESGRQIVTGLGSIDAGLRGHRTSVPAPPVENRTRGGGRSPSRAAQQTGPPLPSGSTRPEAAATATSVTVASPRGTKRYACP